MLNFILNELRKHHRCKDEILTEAINKRLNLTLDNYTKHMDTMLNTLSKKDEKKILRKVNE